MRFSKTIVFFVISLGLAGTLNAQAAGLRIMPSIEQNGKIYLSWPAETGAVKYDIYRDSAPLGPAAANFYADQGLKTGSKHTYRVQIAKEGQEVKNLQAQVIVEKLKTVPAKRKVKVIGSDIIIDGKRLFALGIGIAPNNDDPAAAEQQLKELAEAGFNTVVELPGAELNEYLAEIAAKYGLLVIKSLPVPASLDYANEADMDQVLAQVRIMVSAWTSHSNILAYVMMNKPEMPSILKTGVGYANDFFRKAAEACRSLDTRPVTIINYTATDFIGTDMLDIITTAYDPKEKSPLELMTVRGYLNWLKRYKASDKPLWVFYQGTDNADINTMVNEGLAGVIWVKYPSPVPDSVIITPADGYKVTGPISPLIYLSGKKAGRVKVAEVSFNGKIWLPLFNQGNWWRTEFNSNLIPDGIYSFQLRMGAAKGELEISTQPVKVLIANTQRPVPQRLEILTEKRQYSAKDKLFYQVKVTENGAPMVKTAVKYGLFAVGADNQAIRLGDVKEGQTDDNGLLSVNEEVPDQNRQPYYLVIAATVNSELIDGQRYAERKVLLVNP